MVTAEQSECVAQAGSAQRALGGDPAEPAEPADSVEGSRPDELTGRVNALAAELAELVQLAAQAGSGAGPAAALIAAPDAPSTGDDVRIDRLRALEVLKSAVCAVQACVSAEFAGSQRARQVQAGVAQARAGRGIPSQIGLARRESPYKAQLLLGLATCLVQEMPCTLAALARGDLNEWRATLIARETAVLSREHRAEVDRELCGPGGTAPGLGDAGIVRAARAIAQRLDPGAAWARAQKAARERRVTIRPAPDCMARITALLPVVQGVGVYAALSSAADTAIAAGQTTAGSDDAPAGRQALMADELVARVLGFSATQPANPDQPVSPATPDRSDGSDGPADLADPADPASPGRPASAGRPADPMSASSSGDPADQASAGSPTAPGSPAGSASPGNPASPADPGSPGSRADLAGTGRPAEPSDAGSPARAGSPADPASSASAGSQAGSESPAGSAWYRGPVPRRTVPQPAVELQLIMTDWTLLGLDDEPAHLTGYGPIPAPLARRIASGQPGYGGDQPAPEGADAALRWIRRLYLEPGPQPSPQESSTREPGTREPGTREPGSQERGAGRSRVRGLVGMDSHRRLFPAGLRRFMIARDQFCRTPFCGALIRHIDHINPAADGGPTTASNAQGLCAACNYAKQAPGWQQTSGDSGDKGDNGTAGGEVVTTTPTGHCYTSSPPPPPGSHGSSVGSRNSGNSGNLAEHGVAA